MYAYLFQARGKILNDYMFVLNVEDIITRNEVRSKLSIGNMTRRSKVTKFQGHFVFGDLSRKFLFNIYLKNKEKEYLLEYCQVLYRHEVYCTFSEALMLKVVVACNSELLSYVDQHCL